MILGVLTLVAIITFSPHALSQQNPAGEGQENGIPLGGNYGITTLHSDQAMMGWAAGIASAGVVTGLGVCRAVRKH